MKITLLKRHAYGAAGNHCAVNEPDAGDYGQKNTGLLTHAPEFFASRVAPVTEAVVIAHHDRFGVQDSKQDILKENLPRKVTHVIIECRNREHIHLGFGKKPDLFLHVRQLGNIAVRMQRLCRGTIKRMDTAQQIFAFRDPACSFDQRLMSFVHTVKIAETNHASGQLTFCCPGIDDPHFHLTDTLESDPAPNGFFGHFSA